MFKLRNMWNVLKCRLYEKKWNDSRSNTSWRYRKEISRKRDVSSTRSIWVVIKGTYNLSADDKKRCQAQKKWRNRADLQRRSEDKNDLSDTYDTFNISYQTLPTIDMKYTEEERVVSEKRNHEISMIQWQLSKNHIIKKRSEIAETNFIRRIMRVR